MQKPDATLVAGFNKWRDGFSHFVKKGEKGIKIIAPTPYKIKEKREKLDPWTKAPLLDAGGKVQTISAAIHEVPHSLLHNREMEKELQAHQGENPKPIKHKNRNTEEVEAESISFAVCNYFGIQTTENSLGYIAAWGKGKELAGLRASLETINKTSSELISGIDKHFAEIIKERGMDMVAETSVPEQVPDKVQITKGSSNIEVEGHFGTWYVIDNEVIDGTKYFLLEHEEHGDEAACIIVDGDGKLVLDDVWNGFDDLQDYFDSLEVTAPVQSDDRKPPFHVMEFSGPQWEQIKLGLDNNFDVSLYADPVYSVAQMEQISMGLESNVDAFLYADVKLTAEQMQEFRLGLENGVDMADILRSVTGVENNQPVIEPLAKKQDYPLPDPEVSVLDRNSYGYLDDEMLPLSQERPTKLFEQDFTVYLLYEDNTKAMAFGREDIDTHNGLFGIEKADGLALQEYEEMKADGKLFPEEQEQLFMEHSDNVFVIYQLKDGEDLRDYRFEGLDWLKSRGLTMEHGNYNFVYSEPFTKYATQRDRLEEIWERFNIDHPPDFKGHSLSVSDIIAIR